MLKIVKKLKIILILGLCIAMSLVAASSAMATTVTIASSLNGLVYYDGEYCGTIGATLDGTTNSITGGIACVDISKNTDIGSVIPINISTLQSQSTMTNARFGSNGAAILKYEEAAWLLGQMPSNPTQVGEIQFAMWKLFNPGYAFQSNADRKTTIEDYWFNLATNINPNDYNFSSVYIYTPVPGNANQEFMSGAAIYHTTTGSPAPIPASFVLLGSGLLALGVLSRRKKTALVRGDKK